MPWKQLSQTCIQVSSSKKPNIILIVADDLGYADIGAFGQKHIKTPHLDKMASKGLMLTQFYSASTVCAPSRAGLVTGKHMGYSTIRGNGNLSLSKKEVSIAEPLKDMGYKTAMIGKWGLGDSIAVGPDSHGFDFYSGYLNQIHAHNYFPEYLLEDGDTLMLDNEVVYMPEKHWTKGLGSYATKKVDYSNDIFTQKALDFIGTTADKPFFVYLPYTIPHNNGEAEIGERQEVPDYGIYAEEDWETEQKGYAAMITRLDDYVGSIMEILEKEGLDKNTLVLFTSDNGPMMDKEFCRYFDSNGIFRGGKRDLYEGGLRVPTIAYWPGTIESGSTDAALAAWDLLPTFADLAGAPEVPNINGISFKDLLVTGKRVEHKYLYWEYRNGHKNYLIKAYREGDWKLVIFEHFDGRTEYELYNLKTDKAEQNNLSTVEVSKLDELVKKIPSVREAYDYSR